MNIQNQCADCGKEFSSSLCFNKHYREYHQKNESNCNICERKFHTAYILKKHIGNVHTIEKCNVCDKSVAKGVLARHMKTHIESKFECEKCENVYTRKDSLQKHQLNCGGDIVKIRKPAVMIFSCETCGKTFTQKRYLTQHKRTHRMDMGKFDCKLCDKIYTSNQKLGKHIEKLKSSLKTIQITTTRTSLVKNMARLSWQRSYNSTVITLAVYNKKHCLCLLKII